MASSLHVNVARDLRIMMLRLIVHRWLVSYSSPDEGTFSSELFRSIHEVDEDKVKSLLDRAGYPDMYYLEFTCPQTDFVIRGIRTSKYTWLFMDPSLRETYVLGRHGHVRAYDWETKDYVEVPAYEGEWFKPKLD